MLCKVLFEVRQNISDEPLDRCPRCGSNVKKVFSRNFIAVIDSLSQKDSFASYTEEKADNLGLSGGFAKDQVWE
jgi:putative FmdB family regulatory protein